MSIEVLDTETVRKIIEERGWTLGWVIRKIGEKQHYGYVLLREGHLPKDPDRKSRVLSSLAQLLGVQVPQILVTLEARRSA